MPEPIKRFWNFIDNGAEGVTLRLDGEIIDDDWAWIYDWFGIPAASPNAFRKELAKYAGKSITLWIDSYGGSVYAGVGIYNALMEHKNSGTGVKITSVGDSHIMSAATLPYLAGDERLMTPGAVFMIHKPLIDGSGYAGYATDLRKTADVLDTIEDSIINIYALSTGASRERLAALMANETYMGANAAIKEGFATGMKYAKDDEKPLDIMNFSFDRLAVLNVTNSANESVKKFFEMLKEKDKPSANQTENPPAANMNSEEGGTNTLEIKNVDDLKKAYPEFVDQLVTEARNQGTNDERKRIQDISAMAGRIDPALVSKALFETPINAAELAMQAFQAEASAGKTYLATATAESAASGVDNVGAAPVAPAAAGGEKPKSVGEKFVNIVAGFNAKRTGVQM
jgi:ATP-dependent protease ClpP protease subunit